jgi:uncharacterized protein (TIGR03437 family)
MHIVRAGGSDLMTLRRFLFLCVAFSPLVCGEIRVLAVTTSAAFVHGMPSRGSLATLFCTGLQGITGIVSASQTPLPRMLADVRVTIGKHDAPLLAVADLGAFQIVNFQVPWEGEDPPFTVSQGANSTVFTANQAPWGQFFIYPSGDAIAQHDSDGRLVTPVDPARPDEWITLYGTNFGGVVPQPPTGVPAAWDPLSYLNQSGMDRVLLTQSGQDSFLTPSFIGLAPGTVGVYQVTVHMPRDLEPGKATLVLQEAEFCGFFFTPGCGRGFTYNTNSTPAKLPVGL